MFEGSPDIDLPLDALYGEFIQMLLKRGGKAYAGVGRIPVGICLSTLPEFKHFNRNLNGLVPKQKAK
jgi:hypothetical protein